MRPYVHCFVVDHEDAFEYLGVGVEINAIAVGDMVVVLHEGGSLFERTNEGLNESSYI